MLRFIGGVCVCLKEEISFTSVVYLLQLPSTKEKYKSLNLSFTAEIFSQSSLWITQPRYLVLRSVPPWTAGQGYRNG